LTVHALSQLPLLGMQSRTLVEFAQAVHQGLSRPGVVYLRTGPFEATPHPAPRRQWVVMLRGALRVAVTDGTSGEFRPGDLLLLEDTSGTGHVQKTVGDPPFEALFIPAP
jgi:hypothetical protein